MTKAEQMRILTAIVLPPAVAPHFDNKERIERARQVAKMIYNKFEERFTESE